MNLILKPANSSRPSDHITWSKDDYDVICDGKVVGRLFKPGAGVPVDRPWQWVIGGYTAETRGVKNYGFEPSREEACEAFRQRFEQLVRGAPGET